MSHAVACFWFYIGEMEDGGWTDTVLQVCGPSRGTHDSRQQAAGSRQQTADGRKTKHQGWYLKFESRVRHQSHRALCFSTTSQTSMPAQ